MRIVNATCYVALSVVLTTLFGLSALADEPRDQVGDLDRKRAFSIEAQALDAALLDFSDQANVQVMVANSTIEGLQTDGIEGVFTPRSALTVLLNDNDLEFTEVGDTIAVTSTGQGGDSDSKNLSPAPVLTAQATPRQTPTRSSSRAGDEARRSTITGKVMDARTAANLKGARVTILETGQSTHTSDLGEFRFPGVAEGQYTLHVSYLGYTEQRAEVSARHGEVATAAFALAGNVELEEIVVYGTRSARAIALSQERAAENSASVVSADMLGNFTGTTISEALRRVAGISFQRDLQTGDGVNVIVRGLEPDMNAVKLNGLHLPVVNGTDRSADLSTILADSVDTITVNKSLLPKHDSAGTGGLIEIETKSPLGRPRRYLNFVVEGGRKDTDFGDDLLLSGTASGTFGNKDNFGLSASIQHRDRELKSVEYGITGLLKGQYLPLEQDGTLSISSISHIDPRTAFPFETGASDVYTTGAGSSLDETETSNLAITLSGEWLLADHTSLRLDVQRSTTDTDVFAGGTSVDAQVSYQPLPVAALGGEPRQAAAWSGLAPINQSYMQGSGLERKTTSYSLNGDSNVGRWEFDYTLGYARGTSSSPDITAVQLSLNGNSLPNDPDLFLPEATDPLEGRIISIYGTRTDRGLPLPLLSDAGWSFVNDPANYGFNSAIQIDTQGKNDRYTANFSAKLNLDRDHLKYIQVGVDYESAEFSDLIDTTLFIGRMTFVPVPCCSFQFPSVDSLGLTFEDRSFSEIGLEGPGFDVVSRSDLAEFAAGLVGLAEDPAAPVDALFIAPDPRAREAFTKEENLAAYVQARVDFGKLEIIGGIRFSRVEVQAVNLTAPAFVDEFFQPDLVFAQEFTRLVDERAVATDILPRVLFNYRQNDKLVFRGGYYLSVARPQINQLSSDRNIILSLPPLDGPDRNQPLLQIDEGNPDLEPALTHNFNLGVELYDNRIGVLKLEGFYKRIDNLLQTNARVGTDSLEGVTLPDHPAFQDLPDNIFVRVSRPINSEHTAEHWGVEAHIEHQFTFLPGFWNGFGVFANYTYTESSRHRNLLWAGSPIFDDAGNLIGRGNMDVEFSSVPFDQQPKYSGTAALTYNKHNIDATLAYSFQDRRLALFEQHNLSVYEEGVDSLDFRIEYRSPAGDGRYRVYLEGLDLLKGTADPELERSVGGTGGTPKYYTGANYLGGRAFRLGFAASF